MVASVLSLHKDMIAPLAFGFGYHNPRRSAARAGGHNTRSSEAICEGAIMQAED